MNSSPLAILRPALVLLVLFTLVTGLAYPFAVTGVAQAAFPEQANGSLIRQVDRVVGSALVGQAFAGPTYLHSRPSAAGEGYDASASSGSNLGPTSRALVERTAGDVERVRAEGVTGAVPADLVTASASGLDPHVSPAAAEAQVARIAAARGVDPEVVRAAIARHTDAPFLGVFGAPAVNVLETNLALDAAGGPPAP